MDKQHLLLADMAIHLLLAALKPGDIELAKLKNGLGTILTMSDEFLSHADLNGCINFAYAAPTANVGHAPEPSRSQLVIDILERRKAGDSFGCIAHALNKQGIPGEHGGRWYGSTVRNIVLRTQAEAN
jgi:hypothetical protein